MFSLCQESRSKTRNCRRARSSRSRVNGESGGNRYNHGTRETEKIGTVQRAIFFKVALEALKRGVPDSDRHLSEGNIELVSDDQWFRKGGSIIGPAAVVERFRKKLRAAISEGYVGLRANGSAVTFQKTKRLSELEKQLDDLTADKKMILLCSFPLEESTSSAVLDAARTHQLTAVRRIDPLSSRR